MNHNWLSRILANKYPAAAFLILWILFLAPVLLMSSSSEVTLTDAIAFGLVVLTLLFGSAVSVSYIVPKSWVGDTLSSFTAHFFVAALVMLGFSLLLSNFWLAVVASLVIVGATPRTVKALGFSPDTETTTSPTESATSFSVLSFNVYKHNKQRHQVVEYIEKLDPDFLFLYEVTSDWEKELTTLSSLYPNSVSRPSEDSRGIWFGSKDAMDLCEVHQIDRAYVGLIKRESLGLAVAGIHTDSPGSARRMRLRNLQLEGAVELVKNSPHSFKMLTGDFNISPYALSLDNALEHSGLKRLAPKGRILHTWQLFPTWLGGLQIDHAVVSSSLGVSSYEQGSSLGSDHKPQEFCIYLK